MSRITHDITGMLSATSNRSFRGKVPEAAHAAADSHGFHPGEVPRMLTRSPATNPVSGTVVWSPIKSAWFTAHLLIFAIGGSLIFSYEAVVLSIAFTVASLS